MENIEIHIEQHIARIYLNRQDKRNALNEPMIKEVIEAFDNINQSKEVRVVLLSGRGKVFCAGADLNYMKEIARFGKEENFSDSMQLSQCFQSIYHCTKPTIAKVHGAAIGGGNGLLAACDFAYCTGDTQFAFSEVKLGITPATISPFVIKRMGESNARDLMISGRLFKGSEAERTGLVNKSFGSEDEMDTYINGMIQNLMQAGPEAISACKRLIEHVSSKPHDRELYEFTARMIADLRASAEGQAGMKAFLEKSKAPWTHNK